MIEMLKRASWIYAPAEAQRDALIFAKAFSHSAAVRSAVAYVSAMGVYELNINGTRVGDARLTPGWTNYKRRIQFQCYDIGDHLAKGENLVELHCGRGWAGQLTGATQKDLIATAFFAYIASLMVKTCRALGRDPTEYEMLHARVRAKFRECFMREGLPTVYPKYDACSTDRPVKAITQTAIALILKFDLCEASERPLLAQTLTRLIRERGDRMTMGFVGTPYILHALSENGCADVAYDLLLQGKSPSWLYAVDHGATTVWEHWDGIREDGSFWSADMNSFNHYAYGAVYDWIFGVSAGIKICEDGAGYRKVRIAPVPDRRLGYINASLKTQTGVLTSAWKYEGDRIEFEVSLPAGCTAEFEAPDGKKTCLTGESTFRYTLKGIPSN